MTEDLQDKRLGDFIVYESTELREHAGNAYDPSYDYAPLLEEDIIEEQEEVEEAELSEEEEGDPFSFTAPQEDVNESVVDVEPEPGIVIPTGPVSKAKPRPLAARVAKVARVVRRGEVLGAFMDDACLDVKVWYCMTI